MKRLTVFDGEFWLHKDFPPVREDTVDEFVDCVKDMASRLALIENILGDDYDLDRLKELVEADRDGRCVVLPCKIGDTVYDILMGKITEKTIISIPFLMSKSVNHLCLQAINNRDALTTIETENLGKTVFLTREEAEAALEEMKERDK